MKKTSLFIAMGVLLFSAGCKKYVEGEDISPNAPASATPPLILSASELSVFATYGGNLGRITSMWAQQNAGCQFQSEANDQYVVDEGDISNEWDVIYTRGLKNLRILKNQAGAANPTYQGISNVLTALMLGTATDLWGDVPYSDALKGEDLQLSAAYDKQEDVLKTVQNLLTEAVSLLSKGDDVIVPGADDFIYGGDNEKWIGFAYMLKARYHMRTSKRNSTWHTDALKAIDSARAYGVTSEAADANCVFGTNSNEYNQWYAFVKVSRRNYIKASKTFTDLMNTINDPRRSAYFTKNDSGRYEGSALGSSNLKNVSEIGSYFASPSSVTPLATYVESMFIEAEAALAAGDKGRAAGAHNEAIKAHLTQVTGSADPAYVAAQASETAASITLEKIMTHKYVAGYTMMEPYNDWRRTGIPALVKNPNSNLSGIARRLPTSIDERLYNTKATVVQNLMEPVWWDQ
ncbi:MAG: hypothetical protein RLZZ370_266 [Bacteroidota bacterium]|jgi:hypothetical protein